MPRNKCPRAHHVALDVGSFAPRGDDFDSLLGGYHFLVRSKFFLQSRHGRSVTCFLRAGNPLFSP